MLPDRNSLFEVVDVVGKRAQIATPRSAICIDYTRIPEMNASCVLAALIKSIYSAQV